MQGERLTDPEHAECLDCGATVDGFAYCVDDVTHDTGWRPCEDCDGEGSACFLCSGYGIRPTQRLRKLAAMTPRVGHCKRDRCGVYIGRGSKWGNPYVWPGTARRSKHDVIETEDPLAAYEEHIWDSPHLLADLDELRGKTLGCWCVRLDDPDPERREDERCHGHVLQRLVREVCGDG